MMLHEKVVLSTYTGILMCGFSEVHEYIEKLLSRPVWTHEPASEALWETIKERAKPDFLRIIESWEGPLWQKSDPGSCSIYVIANAAATDATIPVADTLLIFLILSMVEPFQMDLRR